MPPPSDILVINPLSSKPPEEPQQEGEDIALCSLTYCCFCIPLFALLAGR